MPAHSINVLALRLHQSGQCFSPTLLVLGGAGGPQALLPGFEGDPAWGQVIPSSFLLPPPKAAQKESNKVGLGARFVAQEL